MSFPFKKPRKLNSTRSASRWMPAALLLLLFVAYAPQGARAQNPSITTAPRAPERVIIDTDIGDDIDDAFAVALALRSPELTILGFSTALGDTSARAAILDRLLGETGNERIPVTIGPQKPPKRLEAALPFFGSQFRYGRGGNFRRVSHPDAIEFTLEKIRQFPGEITLVTTGPLSNVGPLIDRDPVTFRKLKRVVMMGGSVGVITPDYGSGSSFGPIAEWNILNDITSAQKLFQAGVPIYMMPVDATVHLKLDDVKRSTLFSEGTPLTDALAQLYGLWSLAGNVSTPILHDALPIAFIVNPQLCQVTALHIRIDENGFTHAESGTPNAYVCMHSDLDAFFRLYLKRIVGSQQN